MKFRFRPFTVRPWKAPFGDPAMPIEVLGVRVSRLLLVRSDQSGALVALEDGRFAVTGAVLAAGQHRDVAAYLRQRAGHATDSENAWSLECCAALSTERARRASARLT